MKIITNDAIYVQKNDIGYLNQTNITIPASIFMKVFGKGIVIIDNSNRYEFVKFEDQKEIEFFKGLDWIINYEDVRYLDEKEILKSGETISQEINNIAKTFNKMSEKEIAANVDMIDEYELLKYKLYSLRDVLWFIQGELKFTLPEGVEYPTYYQVKEEKGIKRLFKKIRRNTNN